MTPPAEAAAPIVRLRGAAFGYAGISRVAGLTLDIVAGSAVALIGPNGSGKSTLLRGILGLAELTAGEVEVLGTTPLRARRDIGTLPQSDTRDASLPLSLRQVVGMGLYRELGPVRPFGHRGGAAVNAALDRVGLASLAGRRFGELSGGQQQRGILARALVANPRLLLLDEPFNGLDRENRDTLLALVRELRAEGRTLIISTHDLEIAQEACTHVLLLATGHDAGPAERSRVSSADVAERDPALGSPPDRTVQEIGHPAGFGPIDEALTLEAVEHAFHDATVELDQHTVTTTRETE